MKSISDANNSLEVINYAKELIIYAYTRQNSLMLLVLILNAHLRCINSHSLFLVRYFVVDFEI